MKKKMAPLPGSVMLYLAFSLFMAAVISLKANYYIDEIYSYGLANSTGDGIDIEIEYDRTYLPGASVYTDYMTVQRGERFHYANVWKNQENDVHPPLYYAVLHTICSFFPDRFSRWFPGMINMASALLVLFVLRKILRILTAEPYILNLLSVSFIFMTGILLASAYFRMYLLSMLWVASLCFIVIRQVGRTQDFRFYAAFSLLTAAGALTHYYVIVYTVFLSCAYGCYLLFMKRGKEMLLLIRFSRNHFGITGGSGEEPVTFGFDRDTVIRYMLIILPCVLYFLLVAKMTFISADRYISPIYAVFWGGSLCMALTAVKRVLEKRTFFAFSVMIAAALAVGSYRETGWQYLYRESVPFLETVKQYKDYDCICVLDEKPYTLYPEFAEYLNYKSITFVTTEDLRENGIRPWMKENAVLVSFISNKDIRKEMEKIIEENAFSGYEELGGFGYDRTFYCYD